MSDYWLRGVDADNNYKTNVPPHENATLWPGHRIYTELTDPAGEYGLAPEPYVEPEPTEDQLKAYLAEYRWRAEIGGVVMDIGGTSYKIHTDRAARLNHTQMHIGAANDPAFTVRYKTMATDTTPPEFITLDQAQTLAMADAAARHVDEAFRAEDAVLQDMADPQTPALDTYEKVATAFDAALATIKSGP